MACARQTSAEIVSCDSVQIYRGFDIGSAKPSRAEQLEIPHHMIDCADWNEGYDAARYAREARAKIEAIRARGRLPVVVGGTGLYLRALLQQEFHEDLPSDESLREELRREDSAKLYERLKSLDPRRASELHPNDVFRVVRALEINILTGKPVEALEPVPEVSPDFCIVVLDPDRRMLHEQIARRTGEMLAAGLEDEVRGLIDQGVDPDCKPMQSIGYHECVEMFMGRLERVQLEEKIIAATRQYAKRQCTWFRKVKADYVLSAPHLELVSDILRATNA